ncbi:hypothetical protein ACLB2K_047961 [Fragaria x ananassa]
MGMAGGLAALAIKCLLVMFSFLVLRKRTLLGFPLQHHNIVLIMLRRLRYFKIQTTPPALRMRSGRLLAAKSTLAARVDSTRADPSGNTGKALREEIHNKIEKWQEPPPAKQPKPLPVPDSEPKKKRGDGLGEGYGMLGQAGRANGGLSSISNPQAHGQQLDSGTQSTYFSETGTFSKVKRI